MDIKSLQGVLWKIPVNIRQRGLILHASQGVKLTKFANDIGRYEFEVEGQSQNFYTVVIEDNPKVKLHCNCAYFDQNALCKHTSASIEFLSANEQKLNNSKTRTSLINKPDPNKITRNTKQPISIKEASTNQETQTLLRAITKTNARESYRFFNLEIFENKITVETTSYYTYSNNQQSKCTLEWKSNKSAYQFSCAYPKHNHLCDHIIGFANLIADYDSVNFLELVKSEHSIDFIKKTLSELNVTLKDNETPFDLIQLKLGAKGLTYETKGRISGLTTFNEANKLFKSNLLKPITEINNTFTSHDIEAKNYTPLPAFVWYFTEEGTFEGIACIKGKPTKDRSKLASFITLIETANDPETASYTDFRDLYLLKEDINDLLEEDYIEENGRILELTNTLAQQANGYLHYFVKSEYNYLESAPRKAELNKKVTLLPNLEQSVVVTKDDEYTTTKRSFKFNEAQLAQFKDQMYNPQNDTFYYFEKLSLLGIAAASKDVFIHRTFRDSDIKISSSELSKFISKTITPLSEYIDISFDESLGIEEKYETIKQKRIYITDQNGLINITPRVLYNQNQEPNVMIKSNPLVKSGKKHYVLKRDYDNEETMLFKISQLHPSFSNQLSQNAFTLTPNQFQHNHWFLHAFEKIKALNIHIFGLNELKSFRFNPNKPNIKLDIGSGIDWFETELNIAFGNNQVSLKQLKKAIAENNGFVELDDGSLGVLPSEWFQKFKTLFRSATIDKEDIKIAKNNFAGIEELIDPEKNISVYNEIIEKKNRLTQFEKIVNVKKPTGLKATFRDYQQHGFNWLNFLKEYGWGGILADDMGLGKTIQALALILNQIHESKTATNLVVAPTTLIFNWKNEIEKFAPKLKYYIHHGSTRSKNLKELNKHNLILTSYGTCLNDQELLSKINFDLIIADESQAIKNVNSKRFKSLASLKGNIRIAMSGTPIENNIFELYAQMSFANPGFFQGISAFRKNYASPIEKDNDELIKNELRAKTKPFILRRTKQEVLTELPDKTEEIIQCEMSAAQRKVYDAYRNEYRNHLLGKIETDGLNKSKLFVLEGLTRLRQVCDSPQLIEKDQIDITDSAKLDELEKHVLEKTGQHKLLIFSQFVGMLSLIKQRFDSLDIGYEYLDGKTSVKEREKRVANFQNNADCRAFLISLKAGGTGLNLTAADYVYIVDPWWNPAVENQAIDRCYRMGQTKKVIAYRMICRNSVEEKILELQSRKKNLSNDIVGDGEGFMKTLKKEDLEALFS